MALQQVLEKSLSKYSSKHGKENGKRKLFYISNVSMWNYSLNTNFFSEIFSNLIGLRWHLGFCTFNITMLDSNSYSKCRASRVLSIQPLIPLGIIMSLVLLS